jgi:hypothetical protein
VAVLAQNHHACWEGLDPDTVDHRKYLLTTRPPRGRVTTLGPCARVDCELSLLILVPWRRYTILLHVSLGLQKLHDMGDVPSLVGAVLTENRLCHACSAQDKVRMVAYSD